MALKNLIRKIGRFNKITLVSYPGGKAVTGFFVRFINEEDLIILNLNRPNYSDKDDFFFIESAKVESFIIHGLYDESGKNDYLSDILED